MLPHADLPIWLQITSAEKEGYDSVGGLLAIEMSQISLEAVGKKAGRRLITEVSHLNTTGKMFNCTKFGLLQLANGKSYLSILIIIGL